MNQRASPGHRQAAWNIDLSSRVDTSAWYRIDPVAAENGVTVPCKPAGEVALEAVTVPGLAMSLPAGELTERYAFREVGSLAVQTRHLDLGLVELAWTVGEESPNAGLEQQLAMATRGWCRRRRPGSPGSR